VIVTGTAFTVTVAEPETFVYPACAELAMQVAVPTPLGVRTPPVVIVPPVAVQVTAELYAPVPNTVAEHVAVCAIVIVEGEADAETEVTVGVGVVPPPPVLSLALLPQPTAPVNTRQITTAHPAFCPSMSSHRSTKPLAPAHATKKASARSIQRITNSWHNTRTLDTPDIIRTGGNAGISFIIPLRRTT